MCGWQLFFPMPVMMFKQFTKRSFLVSQMSVSIQYASRKNGPYLLKIWIFQILFVFPLPSQGIIILRNPSQLLPEAEYITRMVILKILEENPRGHFWIVDRQQIRIWPRK